MRGTTAGLLALALLAGAGCGVRAHADGPYRHGPYGGQRVAYDRGYHGGLISGERDARAGLRLEFRRNHLYRDGLHGYEPYLGSRGQYRQTYRVGFEAGYRDGYQRGVAYGRRGGRVAPYGHARPGHTAHARQSGFSDGYLKGRDDGRGGGRFDPRRHRWYRAGDRGYRRDFGSKDAYARLYREGFLEGYERGYYEVRGRGAYGRRY